MAVQSMNLETVTKLAAEIEAANSGWRPVKMVRYDWGWRLYVESGGGGSMSLAWYEPWSDIFARHENEYAGMPIVDLEIDIN